MNKLYFFVGASGVGKSTLINYLNENFKVEAKENSARPFLPKGGSYDEVLTDEAQVLIVQNRTLSVLEDILKQNETGKPLIYSRSPIDNLAYQNVLQKGVFMNNAIIREINILKPYCKFLYIPIEFPLDPTDEVRGTNENVRIKTDIEILHTLASLEIEYETIKGTIEERYKQLDNIFNNYKISNSL